MSWQIEHLTLVIIVGLTLTLVAVAANSSRRNKKVLLSRPMADRLTRWIAGMLILIPAGRAAQANELRNTESKRQDREDEGKGESKRKEQLQDADQEIPISETLIHQWRRRQMFAEFSLKENQKYLQSPAAVAALSSAEREKLFAELKARESPMANLILNVVQATSAGHRPQVTVDDLEQAWAYREGMGAYDPWWDAWLWRVTQYVDRADEPEGLRTFFAKIEQRARVTDALTKAAFEVKPTRLNPRAWMSKAGPPREVRLAENAAVEAMLRAARRAYAQDIPTTWQRDAVIRLKLSSQSAPATLWREGKPIRLEAGDTFRFGRLDVLQSGQAVVLIRDIKFGTLQLEANQHATVWQLPGLLRPAPLERMHSLVAQALTKNDEQAARDLELALPLTHAAIRAVLHASPDAPGAPRLRLILALFDDTVIDNADVNNSDNDSESHGSGEREIPSTERSRRGLGMSTR